MTGLLFSFLFRVAMAQEPTCTTTINPDGSVQVQAIVPASEAEIRAVLSDPVRCSSLAPDVVRVQVMASRGNCSEVVTTTRIPGSTMDYRSLRCRTSTGWNDTLIEGDVMEEFQAQWELRAVEGGTEVTFRVRTVLDLPIPSYLVRTGMQSSVKATMLNLIREVTD
jgi:hypothetical protein